MEQKTALEVLKSGVNVFLTGQAGAGKTYVLNQYIVWLRKRQIEPAITASTGIAATHIGGVTLHSWSGIGVRKSVDDDFLKKLRSRHYLRQRMRKVRVLIVDEISMLDPLLLHCVDRVLQSFKNNEESFGGLQVIFTGDFFQLPPVKTESGYAFGSSLWPVLDFAVCYLKEQHRQKDDEYLAILNELRTGKTGLDSLTKLKSRYHQPVSGQVPARLYTHNRDVDRINDRELAALEGRAKRYTMKSRGNEKLVASLKQSVLAPEVLRLKEGAAVLFVKNNVDKGYVNGTQGRVIGFDDEHMPLVKTVDGLVVPALPERWVLEEGDEVLAEIRQVPLRLAWAITVHKSQGMSLQAAEVDLSGAFETGQGYVALSRITALQGLTLRGLNETALQADEQVIEQDQRFQAQSRELEKTFAELSSREREIRQKVFILRCGGVPEKPAGKRKKKEKSHG